MTSLYGTEPYPWPYDGLLDPARLALVVAGAQAGWRDASIGGARVAARIGEVASALRAAGAAVVWVRHDRPSHVRRPTLFPPPPGTDAAVSVPVGGGDDVMVTARGVDGFCGGPLDQELRGRGIDRLVLAGYGAEAAVDSTLRSANDRGYECLVLTDAVAPFDPALARHALASVTMSGGIFGAVGPSAALIDALRASIPVPLEVQ